MQTTEPDTPVQLRRGMGVVVAVLWNAPLVLLFWFPFSVFVLVMVANCFLWSLGCYCAGQIVWCRAILFKPNPDGIKPRWTAAALGMAILGTGCFIGWLFDPK